MKDTKQIAEEQQVNTSSVSTFPQIRKYSRHNNDAVLAKPKP